MDLVKYSVKSIDGYRYSLTTLNDHFSFEMTWFLKHKSDALAGFKRFVAWAETQFGRKVEAIHLNREGGIYHQGIQRLLGRKGN